MTAAEKAAADKAAADKKAADDAAAAKAASDKAEADRAAADKAAADQGGAPIQGLGMEGAKQSGEGTTAAEVGTDRPGVAADSKAAKGVKMVDVRVKTPMSVTLNEEESKAAGLVHGGLYAPATVNLVAGLNSVPQAVADHWLVQGNLAEE